MVDIRFLVKGILIGLLFGIPVGAVGVMTIQRTFCYGFMAGIKTGMGSSAADCFYAACGSFGLTFISDFLLKYQIIINIIGGILLLVMGIRLVWQGNTDIPLHKQAAVGVKMFLSSFAVGITNPAAILTFLFAFSYFGISGRMEIFQGMQLVLGVFIGTCIWWCLLSGAVSYLKKRKREYKFYFINQIFGVVLIVFGSTVFINTIF